MASIAGRGGIITVEDLRAARTGAHSAEPSPGSPDETPATPLASGPLGATEVSDNVFEGTEGDDNDVFGEETDDTVRGLGGNDYIWGGAGGIDRLEGGTGDDIYSVEDGDIVVELAGEGVDTVWWYGEAAAYAMTDNVENLHVSYRFDGVEVTGNALGNEIFGDYYDDTLRGMGGDDRLDGGWGVDRLIGGAGDDTYFVEQNVYDDPTSVDVVVEAANEGIDTVYWYGEAAYQMTANVENIVVIGYSLQVTGNALNNDIESPATPTGTTWAPTR